MPARLTVWIERIRDGFWAIPSAAALLAVLLGLLLPWVDRIWVTQRLFDGERRWLTLLLFEAGGDGARATLAAVSGSSITVAGTVFSITIATLALVSSQFGPRLLRTFSSDRGVQISLGIFVLSFLFPLLVLRTVRTSEEDGDFVPHLSVSVALLFAVSAVGTRIYFIDHIAQMIRAPQVVATVGRDLDEALNHAVPDGVGKTSGRKQAHRDDDDNDDDNDDEEEPDEIDGSEGLPGQDAPVAVRSRKAGYLTVINHERLVTLAEKADVVFRLAAGTGSYVYEGTPLLQLRPGDKLDEEQYEEAHGAFAIGARRTVKQDEAYAVNQLVEIGVRAMSPGINDPFTGQSCCQRITAGLVRVADRRFPDPRQRDEGGKVRLLTRRPTFADLVEAGYAPLRRYARADAMLLGCLLDDLAALAGRAKGRRRLGAIAEQAAAVSRAAEELDEVDRRIVRGKYAYFEEQLAGRLG